MPVFVPARVANLQQIRNCNKFMRQARQGHCGGFCPIRMGLFGIVPEAFLQHVGLKWILTQDDVGGACDWLAGQLGSVPSFPLMTIKFHVIPDSKMNGQQGATRPHRGRVSYRLPLYLETMRSGALASSIPSPKE